MSGQYCTKLSDPPRSRTSGEPVTEQRGLRRQDKGSTTSQMGSGNRKRTLGRNYCGPESRGSLATMPFPATGAWSDLRWDWKKRGGEEAGASGTGFVPVP